MQQFDYSQFKKQDQDEDCPITKQYIFENQSSSEKILKNKLAGEIWEKEHKVAYKENQVEIQVYNLKDLDLQRFKQQIIFEQEYKQLKYTKEMDEKTYDKIQFELKQLFFDQNNQDEQLNQLAIQLKGMLIDKHMQKKQLDPLAIKLESKEMLIDYKDNNDGIFKELLNLLIYHKQKKKQIHQQYIQQIEIDHLNFQQKIQINEYQLHQYEINKQQHQKDYDNIINQINQTKEEIGQLNHSLSELRDKKGISVDFGNTNYVINCNTFADVFDQISQLENKQPSEFIFLHKGNILCREDCGNEGSIEDNIKFVGINDNQGGSCLKFMKCIMNQDVNNLTDLINSFDFHNKKLQIQQFIEADYLKLSKLGQNEYQKNYFCSKIEEAVAIRLWTSNLIYSQCNKDIADGKYKDWSKFLKVFTQGLKQAPFVRGTVFRGFKTIQDDILKEYQKGNFIYWKQISGLSLKYKVAESFSSEKGILFEVKASSSKNISTFSIYPGEEEVILQPFQLLYVQELIKENNKPIKALLREIPVPRLPKVIFWVDDQPENNYQTAQQYELQNEISVVFCTSTNDAKKLITEFRWLLQLENAAFRVVTDMVRIEDDNKANYEAGIDLIEILHKLNYQFEVLIFCRDVVNARKNCEKRNLQGSFSITNVVQELEDFISFKKIQQQN